MPFPIMIVDGSITNFSDSSLLASQLDASTFFFMTDMESQDPNSISFFPVASRAVFENWVNNGGVMVMTGTFGPKDTDFLNLIFGWNLTTVSGSSWAKNTANTAGTPFDAVTASSLPNLSATDAINKNSVANFTTMWGTDDNAVVAVIEYGSGYVIFMGWDFYNSGPGCPQYSSDWVQQVVPAALEYASELSQASISNISYTTADLTYTFSQTGQSYYIAVADGATAPSAAQIKAGVDYAGVTVVNAGNAATTAGTPHVFNMSGFTNNTTYDVYVVNEYNDEGTPTFSVVSSYNFTTLENDAPVLSGLSNQTVECANNNSPEQTLTITDAYPGDNTFIVTGSSSNTALVQNSGILISGSGNTRTIEVSPEADSYGTTTITILVEDSLGAQSSTTFTVTVQDTEAPVASCAAPFSVFLDSSGNASITLADIDNVSTDNCNIASITISQTDFDCSHIGENTITLTVLDDAGNSTTCTTVVTIVDNQDPVVVAQNLSFQLNDPNGIEITPAMVDNGTTDICSFTLSLSKTNFNCSDIGTQTIVLTATDAGGNVSSANAEITITAPEPFVVTSEGATQIGNLSTFTTIDPSIGITFTGNANGALVSISDNFSAGDELALNPSYTLPGGVTAAYNGSTGVLTMTGNISDSDLETLFQNVQFRTSSSNTVDRNITFIIGSSVSNPNNNHYYEYVNESLTWVQAKAAAASRTLYGLQGYLATSTSLEENNFIRTKLTNDGWLGGSDEFSQINQAVGSTLYANQAAAEGNWFWITGPEAGTQMSVGNSPMPGQYVNWNAPNEPNNAGSSEHFMQIYFLSQGSWNDLGTGQSLGYIVEYGGLAGDQDCYSFSNDKLLLLNQAPEIDPIANVSGCPGATFSQNVVITDLEDDPNDLTVSATSNNQTLILNANLSVTYNGTNFVVLGTPEAGVQSSAVITVTVTDTGGLSTSEQFTYTAIDDEAPVISCTTNKTAETNTGACTYTHLGNFWDASYDDNCTATLTYELTGATTGTGNTLNGVVFNLGVTTVTWTVTDVGGNTDVCSYTVTVEDNEAPEVTCILEATVETDAGVCSYTHSGTAWDATATDNCSLSALTYTLSGVTTGSGTSLDGVTFNLGTTTVVWTATDAEGNSESCSTTITVEDTEAPVIICISSKLRDTDPGECTYTHSGSLWDSLASDNCNVASLTYELSGATTGNGTTLDGQTFNLGTTTVVWTVIDDAGNTDVCTYTVTIEDNEAPVVSCTGNQSVDTDTDVCTYTHSGTAWDATATDNCGVAGVEYTLSGATTGSGMTLDGVVFNLGTTTVTWTATDNNGNTEMCSYEITVEDNQSPEISCVGNQTIDAGTGVCSYTHSGTSWNATATDNCSVSTITYSLSGATNGSGSSLSGVTFNLGTTTVTWTATDAAGNTDVCSFTVTVEDNESPLAVCQDLTIQLDANGMASIQVEDLNGGSTDNCGNSGLTYTASKTEFDCGDVGVNTVILTVTDAAGNSSSCTAIVTVEDLIAPEALCVAGITLPLDENGEATLTAAMLDGGSMDNCSIADISISQTAFDCSDIGENTVTVTVTDSEGNSTSCTSVVTVADTLPPVISCPGDVTVDPNGNGTYVMEDFTGGVTATDNCTDPVVLITQEPAPNTWLSAGNTYTVTFTAEDEAGNTSSCSFELEVTPFLGTESFNLSSLTMYPNPASTAVNIGNPGAITVDQISIYDTRGRLVVQQQYSTPQNTYTLDVSELSSAVYMVMIQSEDKQTVKRLIVE